MTTYWYVPGKGLIATNSQMLEAAYPLSPETYRYCRDNLHLINFIVTEKGLEVEIDLPGYRDEALSKIRNVNYIVHNGVRIHDDEYPFLHPLGYWTRDGDFTSLTPEYMRALVRARNERYGKMVEAINNAESAAEIDRILEQKT